MPMYDYRCQSCGHEDTGIHQNIKDLDDYQHKCSECGENSNRIMEATKGVIMFKAGYMHTLGAYCNSEREFKDKHADMRRKLKQRIE
jgi:putative FmdB family regulatory protein